MAGDTVSLELRAVDREPFEDGIERVGIQTDQGTIECRYHVSQSGDAAVLWVFGAGGGLGGPAGGLYIRLAGYLQSDGVASLRLDYRIPGQLNPCVLDVLAGINFLESEQRRQIVLVGHSFGGAVVINAAALSPSVIAVAALSSQTLGAGAVAELSPRPVLFMHGEADEVLPAQCSRDLYDRAGEPRQLVLYPGCRHGLDECRNDVDHDLMRWFREMLALNGP
jgi:pimeloyl-ACP methyl ester carboxylesterase